MLVLPCSIISNSFYFAEFPQRCRLSQDFGCEGHVDSVLSLAKFPCIAYRLVSLTSYQISSFEYLPTKIKKFQSEFVISSETPSIILSTLLYYPVHTYYTLYFDCCAWERRIKYFQECEEWFYINLTQAGVIQEEEPEVRKIPHQLDLKPDSFLIDN